MTQSIFTIKPLALEDIPVIAKISGDAFENDRQTIMKGLGSEPFFMEEYTLQSLPRTLKNPRCIVLKAAHNETGETMGYIHWVFEGFPPEEMPAVEGRVQPPPLPPAPATEELKKEDKEEETSSESPVQRLMALQGADMRRWMKDVMPKGTRCLYVEGLQVAPAHQRKGVASALLRFGTDFCDEKKVFAWVHSSESAWKAYQKCGFKVKRELDCDLDAYSPCPPPNEGPDAKWGHYVLRYMKYVPEEQE